MKASSSTKSVSSTGKFITNSRSLHKPVDQAVKVSTPDSLFLIGQTPTQIQMNSLVKAAGSEERPSEHPYGVALPLANLKGVSDSSQS